MEEIKSKIKIDAQTSTDSFDSFCEDWEIEKDFLDLNEEEKADFKGNADKIIKAIMKGRLVYIPETSSFEYTISDKTEKHKGRMITLRRPKGITLRQADRAKQGKDVEKTFMILASMVGDDLNLVDGLDMIDLKPLLAISSLFLAS